MQIPAYVDLNRLFRRGELAAPPREALSARGEPMTTRELALHVVTAKGWDQDDNVLRSAMAYRLVQALGIAVKRGTIASPGMRAGVRLWALPNAS